MSLMDHPRGWRRSAPPLRLPIGTGSHVGNKVRSCARKYKLTLLFAATAVVVVTLATFIVNLVVGGLAESNLVRIAEEQTLREAHHVEAMFRSPQASSGLASHGPTPPVGATWACHVA